MNLTQIRRALVPSIAAVALAGSLAACGSNSSDAGSGASSSSDATTPAAVNNASSLTGGGSTAQGSAQVQWASDYGQAKSGVTINYNQVGSGTGRSSFEQGTYTFAGSDSYLSDPTEYAAAKKQCGADPIEVPDYVSPIAVVFNLSGVSSLNLDGKTIAGIFNGSITTWNDKAIADQNPGVNLPSTAIQPVHRSDDSGTTNNFTDYLAQASQGAWKSPASQTWPTTSGLSGDGTSGVVTTLQGTDGSIGYVDASKAGTFGIVSVKVGSKYVMPTADGAAHDLSVSKLDPAAKSGQLTYKIDRTTTDPADYPLLLVSYLIACPTYKDAKVGALVKDYLGYIVSDAGQASGSKAAGSAPLPANVAKKAQAIVATIK
ncbi:MAG TPA: phosphate ABC transporter substrate-binding protein PstS [Nocardioides sp.]|nr:phosphate ABC transporter substrate-binding protein PstS [Nocardioides sp.]